MNKIIAVVSLSIVGATIINAVCKIADSPVLVSYISSMAWGFFVGANSGRIVPKK